MGALYKINKHIVLVKEKEELHFLLNPCLASDCEKYISKVSYL